MAFIIRDKALHALRLLKPIIEGETEETGEGEQAAQTENEMGESLEGVSATFLKRDDGWSLSGSPQDFRVMAWAKTLRQHLDDYLALLDDEYSLAQLAFVINDLVGFKPDLFRNMGQFSQLWFLQFVK